MLNTATFIGYICTDSVFTGKDDVQYCKFVLAVPRDYKNDEDTRPADFISCVAFGVTAELLYTNFSKGKKICDTSLKIKKWYYEEPKSPTLEDLKAALEG